MTEIDVTSEARRIYVYANGEYEIAEPVSVFITDSGSHRVIDAAGWTHRPETGWIAIKWLPKSGQPAFVA